MESETALLKEMIASSKRIVFFGGAGVSTESGIPDFRSVDGLYNQKYKYPPEEILSHGFFKNKTAEFFKFYKDKIVNAKANPQPNKAHLALAKLEADGKLTAVITQNIDGLHQAAGSKNVLEVHGSIHRNYCMSCKTFFGIEAIIGAEIPKCDCGGMIKPDVVLYGESLDHDILEDAARHILQADALIVGGTSLTVYPAVGLVNYYRGDKFVIINNSETPFDVKANLIIRGSIGNALSGGVGL
ncbi:MAG: NAD-dependent protein deacylase [Clostridiales bacterium]|jgi:NAD-dependent deacetylase|nr:NAD-dependent protein deacylase [Clostridiales bacterium]